MEENFREFFSVSRILKASTKTVTFLIFKLLNLKLPILPAVKEIISLEHNFYDDILES